MDQVELAIRAALAPGLDQPGVRYCVALSGGLDSSVLLHAMASLCPGRLRALYVDHQLHAESGRWGLHCAGLCARLRVPFEVLTVTVAVASGEGPEAAARRARYEALAQALGEAEVLLTAHHRDDLAETLLINLLRGAGPAGLAGIARRAAFATGTVQRPLLDLPRAVLRDSAQRLGLDWIEDPANLDLHLDRNYLRQRILPALEARWPAARSTISRSARLSGEAVELIDALAARDARGVQSRGKVLIAALKLLSAARQRNVLRYLCRRQLGSVPPDARLRVGLAQLLDAASDRAPLLAWPGGEIRRYRGALHLCRPAAAAAAAPVALELPARAGARLDIGAGGGRLRLVRARGQGLCAGKIAPALVVRFRDGGERIRPAGDAHGRDLKKLLQERGVVPWMRGRIPLLYSHGELVAVAGLWVAARVAAGAGETGLRVRWDDHAAID